MNTIVPHQHLTINSILEHAVRIHSEQEIVSINAEGKAERYTYRTLAERVKKLANALRDLGLTMGDYVSTFAWNDIHHMEAYFAIPNLGAICHTVNPRLHEVQIRYILNNAKSKFIIVAPQFIPIIYPLVNEISSLKAVIVLGTDDDLKSLNIDDNNGPAWYSYEALTAQSSSDIVWPIFEENTPSGCCYTSGTTGNPKGVLYSHRSTVLHSMGSTMTDSISLSSRDSVLVVVPMFHVNAWGLPYSAAMTGAKLVLPGHLMGDGDALSDLIKNEGITIGAGVPTVWQNWISSMERRNERLTQPFRTLIGGSATTKNLRESLEALGCNVVPAWGMTETSPLGCINPYGQAPHLFSPGKPSYGVEMRIVNDEGVELPKDGETTGELQIRGPWIARGYIGQVDSKAFESNGWFNTGDIANIYPDGYMHIADRAKDIIKSGGEWISSTILEDVATTHPHVAAAAAIAAPHPKWDERPLLLVVAQKDSIIDPKDILHWFDGKVASWWKPDDVVVINALPLTGTGKVDKKILREKYTKPIEQTTSAAAK